MLAFETALHHEYEALMGLCTYLTGDPDEASDLAQETMIEAWRNQHKLVDPSGIRPWLSAIARNMYLRWRAKRTRQQSLVQKIVQQTDTTADFELDLERGELAELLHKALSLLPPDTREVLIARFIESLTPVEIASRLGITENNVALRLHRGCGALQGVAREELHHEFEALNLFDIGGGWQETSLWCPVCGSHKLEGNLNPLVGKLYLRCPGCYGSSRKLFNSTDMLPQVIGGVKGFKAAYTRLSKWADGYYLPGLRAGVASCCSCGRPVKPTWVDMGDHYRIDASCHDCRRTNYTSLACVSLALPEVQRFWREHPRMRLLPLQQLDEVEGQPTILVTHESVETARRINVLFGLHTYQFLNTSISSY